MNVRAKPDAFAEPVEDQRVETQFRVVSLGGERKAFRLERIFWTAIEAIARLNRRSVPAEIAATLAKAGEGANQSAYLRARCTADLLDLWSIAEARSASPAWERVVETMPCPAFAASRTGRLLQVNAPLKAVLGRKDLTFAEGRMPALELAASIATRLRDVEDEALACNAVFRQGDKRAMLRIRLVAGGAGARSMLLGFAETTA